MALSVSTKQVITNAQLLNYEGLQTLTIVDNKVSDIHASNSDEQGDLDLAGDYLSLGGVDLQINGGLGLAFPDLQSDDKAKLKDICRYLWETGVVDFYRRLSPLQLLRFNNH